MAYPTRTSTGVRTDIVTRLDAALTTVSVHDSREIDVDQDELPCVSVTTLSHEDEQASLSARVFKRTETLLISGRVTGASDTALASAIDTIESAIVGALIEDIEWNLRLTRISATKGRMVEANKRVGGVDLRLEVTYSPQYEVDLTGLEFEEVAVTTTPTDPDGADVSERVFELDQP